MCIRDRGPPASPSWSATLSACPKCSSGTSLRASRASPTPRTSGSATSRRRRWSCGAARRRWVSRPPAPPLGQRPVAPGLATPAPASPSTYVPAATAAPGASEALAGLKTAALAVRGAHLNYLRFSEIELAKDAGGTAGEPVGEPADQPSDQPESEPESEYAPEYAAAWYTLGDAVIAIQQAHAAAIAAATREGTTLQAVSADQPDLTYLFRELEPY